MPAKALLRLDRSAQEALASLQVPGEEDIYLRLVDVFITSSIAYLENLRTADVATAQSTAHSWRSSSAAVGAMLLADICSEIEVNRDARRLAELVAQVESEFYAVKSELEALRG
jgi:HPt (histidine-containing phosphotransfer) domain-containing protein